MTDVLKSISEIVSDICDIPIDEISADRHVIDELGVDSVDFLDVVHEINTKYSIELPVEAWANAVTNGDDSNKYFVLGRLAEHVERLAAAR